MIWTTEATLRGCGSVGWISMIFRHARIVEKRRHRGYPRDTLLFRPMNMLLEFLPLLLFFGVLLTKDIYAAVVVLMVAMPAALAIKTIRTKSLDKMYFWSTIFALGFGALTLYFRNPYFTYWKPTAFYWAVAVVFVASYWIGDKPMAQRFFGTDRRTRSHQDHQKPMGKIERGLDRVFCCCGHFECLRRLQLFGKGLGCIQDVRPDGNYVCVPPYANTVDRSPDWR